MSSPACSVFTFKQGLLAAVAHDLRLDVGVLDVQVSGGVRVSEETRVEATFDARSLRVVCARRNGIDDPSALSASDKRKIEATIAGEVLEVGRFPQIRFVSTSVVPVGEDFRVEGELTLHGVTRALAFEAREEGGVRVAEITLHQPDFGIAPYRAMLGALRLRADVRVRVEVP